MTCCGGFGAAVEAQFTRRRALRELDRYRKQGLGVTTRLLRDGVTHGGPHRSEGVEIGRDIGEIAPV